MIEIYYVGKNGRYWSLSLYRRTPNHTYSGTVAASTELQDVVDYIERELPGVSVHYQVSPQ